MNGARHICGFHGVSHLLGGLLCLLSVVLCNRTTGQLLLLLFLLSLYFSLEGSLCLLVVFDRFVLFTVTTASNGGALLLGLLDLLDCKSQLFVLLDLPLGVLGGLELAVG